MTGWRAFLRETRGASAVEFALILPIFLLFLLGIMDVGRYAWQVNQIEKATQMGVRLAAVTTMVSTDLANESYVGNSSCGTQLGAGDIICKGALGTVTCTSTSCSCTVSPCPASLATYNSAAFNNVLARVQVLAPYVEASNLTVEYSGSGIGYASDPVVAIAPVVTVTVHDIPFWTFSLLGTSLQIPAIGRSLTLEDGQGTASS